MRQKCEECGDFKDCNDIGICHDCIQDDFDLDEWLPEDEDTEDEVE